MATANDAPPAAAAPTAASASDEQLAPPNLIVDLCRQFYHLGWVTGTGGGISIRDGCAAAAATHGGAAARHG